MRDPDILSDADGLTSRFHYDWNDAKQLGKILGFHLIYCLVEQTIKPVEQIAAKPYLD